MRRIRQLLLLHFGAGASTRTIGRELGISPSTVREYLTRAVAAGISWPLAADITDESLMGIPCPAFPPLRLTPRPAPRLLGLGCETQTNARRSPGDSCNQGSGKGGDKPFIGSNGEGSFERGDVQMAHIRRQDRAHISGQLVDAVAQFSGAWCRHKPAPCAHE
jgi:hypothetical protein